jgi:hypothetical protein
MPRTPNEFINPKTADKYAWPVNHSEESETSLSRSVSHGAKSGNGLVLQQADDQPLTFKYTGTIFHKAQVEEMRDWYLLCRSQTIYFKDFAGDEYEVIITAFKPTRHRTLRNPRDFTNAPLWFWRYEIEMEVVRVISGMWEGVL